MTDQPQNGKQLPRLSITKGFECSCSVCGVYAFVESRAEAVAEEKAHKAWHRAQQ